ncbi:Helicase ssl-1 [Hypsibius exemplaris]|uniref:Helicase ssl-1 n=1 Tax=Hypsibius exemplaris TaxID=2072580 RepID=A0A1W0XCL4_HYPEX|nr:Helicase ssl-1 [Hypsibius exemplaris]
MDLIPDLLPNGMDVADEPPPGEDEHNIISLIPLDNSSEETRNNTTELASYPESILHFDPDEGDYWDRRPAAALFEPDVPNLLAECDRLCQPVFFPRSTDQFGSATPWGVVELAKITARAAPQRSREGEDASSSGTSSAQSPYHSHMVSAPSSQTDRALSSGLNASFEVQPTDLLARLKAPNASHGSRPSTSRSPAVIRAPSDSFVAHPSVLASQLSSISAVSGGPSRIVVESQKSGPAQPLVTPATGDVQISSMAIEQEGRILSRIADLRKEGKWEDSRIPKCVIAEPFSRGVKNFTKEVTWVATLIAKERKAKIALAKKIAYAAKRWHEKRAEQVRRMEREEEQRLRKVAKSIGGLVLGWWGEVRKVAQMKQKEEIEVRKQDIRKLHLRHLMDQTEEFSSRMAQGLARSSSTASITATPKAVEVVEDPNDKEYNEAEDSSFEDEEDTISDEEGKESTGDNQMDARQLEDDANIPLEDLLPPGYREMFLAPSTDQPSIKRKRTSSKTLTSDVYELEPKPKKLKEEDDLSLLVNLPTEEEIEDNVMFDEKVKSHEAALEKLQPKGTSLSSTEVVTAVPFLLRGDLREYQHVGLDWLVSLYNNKMNGILADEMGLGKTIQTIAFIAHLASEKNNWGPHLVIVPTSVLLNWELEFKRWCPGLIIKTYYGSRKQRSDLRTGWTKPDSFHICITSYKVATQDYSSFRRMRWRYLILDEAQAIKNYKSQRWMRIAEFPSERRLLLTGTPMQNSLEEVWALLHFLAPELFESLNMFQQLFSNLTAMSEGRKPQDQAIVKQLHTVLRPFILRRMKAEVETQLPKKYEQVLKCRLSKRQRYLYDDYMSRSKTRETLKAGNYLSVINILMQLRKVCNHPNLFEERPVLSPFVMPHQLRLEYPALVFEVLYRDTTDAPYFREVSTSLTKPFSAAPKNLTSFDSSRLAELLPTDDRMLLASDASKPLALPRPLPLGFSTCFDALGLTITDLMAGTPFFPIEDNRLCTESCIHPSPVVTKLRAFTTVASVHTGRVKKAAKKKPDRRNGLSVGALTNGTKKSKPIHALSIESSRVSTKYFTEDLRPSRFRLQREDHSEVLLTANRRKCTTLPLLAGNLVTLLSLDRDDAEPRRSSFKTGFLQCHRAQKENLNPLPFKTRTFGLAGLTEMGASAEKRLDQAEERYWIDHGSVAYDPVRMPPPVLAVHNMPSSFDQKTAAWQDLLRPALEEVSERLHPVERLRVMKFPETRLIQYDCGKLQMLDELLRERFAGGHRCLIFTQMTKVLDVLEVFLTYHGYNYLRLDGSTGIELRQTLMDRFNRDPRYFVFILSTRSGGVGVNLTGADTVVFYDSDWNPTMDAQAQDRCHRIGQTRDVNIYRLISEYTVEENILEKATQKRILGHLAIESGGFTTGVLKRENFKDIFGLKDDEVANAMPDDAVDEESAIAKVEDPEDVAAAKKAKTEAAQDEEDDDDDDEPRFKSIQKFLNPIQCFGVKYVEEYALNQEVMEELEQTREEVERRKREWELSRLELAQTERANAAVEASEPFNVSRSLMDPKVRTESAYVTPLRQRSARRSASATAAVTPSPLLLRTPPNTVAPQSTRSEQQSPVTGPSSKPHPVSPMVLTTPSPSISGRVKKVKFAPVVLNPQTDASTTTQQQKNGAAAVKKKAKKADDPDFKVPLPPVKSPRLVNGGGKSSPSPNKSVTAPGGGRSSGKMQVSPLPGKLMKPQSAVVSAVVSDATAAAMTSSPAPAGPRMQTRSRGTLGSNSSATNGREK